MSLDFTESSMDISEFDTTPRQTPVGPVLKPRTGIDGNVSANANARIITGPGQTDFMELQSVTPVVSTRTATPQKIVNPAGGNSNGIPHGGNPHSVPHGGIAQKGPIEPLIPANLRFAKEKLNHNDTKQVESGEVLEKRSPSSPNKPPNTLEKRSPSSPNKPPSTLDISANVNSISMGGVSEGSTPDEDYQTPSVESMPLPGEHQSNGTPAVTTETSSCKRPFEAFYVNTDTTTLITSIPLGQSARSDSTRGHSARGEPINNSAMVELTAPSARVESVTPVAESFTLHDQTHTVESARAAGIPIVDQSTAGRSELSSSESSDPELQKLRADHRARETQGSPRIVPGQRPESLTVKTQQQTSRSNTRESPKTSFAQIKQEKATGELTNVTYHTRGNPSDTGLSLKSQFQKGRGGAKIQKKTTFAALPNQTTWQENAKSSAHQRDSNMGSPGEGGTPSNSELIDIKMRLEERRRQIENEKRRMEFQWTKNRQRLGKQAFIQVSFIHPGSGAFIQIPGPSCRF